MDTCDLNLDSSGDPSSLNRDSSSPEMIKTESLSPEQCVTDSLLSSSLLI
ncbi:hypothetical protein TorRG33x02_008430 [Trema orientale]|uniref:Uncharacterized protein n=1 Tax=Trema orientale TaxID=63057 RepID=A0A2P5G0Q1_TREOI|nr:hypothetical protein TorRG33x02_008430 [Trema orientale]